MERISLEELGKQLGAATGSDAAETTTAAGNPLTGISQNAASATKACT